METTPLHSLSITGVLSESNRIIKANYIHFITLSLFFLPLTFSLITTPTFRLAGQLFTADHLHNFPPNFLHKPPISHLLYILPLVSTTILIHLLLFCISLTFLLFVGSIVTLLQNIGFVIDYNSIHFIWFSDFVVAMLIVIIIYFHVNWCLACVIAVTESNWGLDPLMRSSYLVKGLRSVSLSLLLYFVFYGGILVFVCTDVALATGLRRSLFVFPVMFGSVFLMVVLLVSIVGNIVLYMYCKGLHGELGIEIAEKLVYFNLHSDDEKVSHVVTVAAD